MNTKDKLAAIERAEGVSLPMDMELGGGGVWLNVKGIKKYALWFATNSILPEAGQINPDIAHSGLNVTSW
ncbi:hypothetical protein [Hafnia sp.]|uniref:hypothetical protein n=1 Tax=Hafnia sp. TaxID=1873498 RepID=UPI002FC9BB99